MDYFVRYRVGLLVAILGYLALIFAVPANAQSYGDTHPYELQKVFHRDNSYAYSEYTLRNNTATGGTKYLSKNVLVSKVSLGALGRSALKWAGPAGLVLGALLDEYGVVKGTDPETGEIELSPWYNNYKYATTAGYFWYESADFSCQALAGGRCLAESVGALAQYLKDNGIAQHCDVNRTLTAITGNGTPTNGFHPSYAVSVEITYSGTWNGSMCTGNGYTSTHTRTVYRRAITSPFAGDNTYVENLIVLDTVNDEQLGEYVLNSEYQMTTAQIADMLKEAVSAAYWNPGWSEMVDAVGEVDAQLNPESESYDETLANNTQSQSPITIPGSSESGTMEIEFPVFCEWASVVCTFIDWVMADPVEPEAVEMPVDEMELPDSVVVGGGSYACPSDISFNALGTTMAYEWGPVCGVSNSVEPVIIVLASIIAVFILLGAVV